MSNSVIIVSNLSKRFRIGKSADAASQRSIGKRMFAPFEYLFSSLREPTPDEVIWALRDVSFEISQGQVVGIIGRNGAGKSTLLKILSRIIEPTSGKAVINGRIGSLLEVGTGFHPELTGRENIFMNGAILGMKRAEIVRKLDEIVAFSEVEKFIDTPVKRYSSGMYVRLAFSVAAHLEPEILLVDEVLAVGDLSFQQKCLERIKRLTVSGMTVLLVSHNMSAIQSACNLAIYLQNGQVVNYADPVHVIEEYRVALMKNGVTNAVNFIPLAEGEEDKQPITIKGFDLMLEDGTPVRELRFGQPALIRISLHASERIERPMINFGIRRGDGVVVSNFNNWYDNFEIDYIEGDCCLEGWLPPLRLVPDFYEIHVLVWAWGGGHQSGGLEGSRPLAWVSFGDFHVTGPALNSNDGVFQVPAIKWQYSRGNTVYESDIINENTIIDVLKKPSTLTVGEREND
jgi:lipopolysaccharide transport system ATP-binding protein